MAKQTSTIEIEGRSITISNPDKVFYPKSGFTKGQVLDYYIRIAPVLLPHLADHPLTLKRYPEGVSGLHFYEKNCPAYRPHWMKTAKIWSEGNRRYMDYCVASDLAALVWLVNLADLELHTSLSKAPEINTPTVVAFDLDPGPPAGLVQCCQVALWIKEIFSGLRLQVFPKTSGGKGLQVYVPLNTAVTYEQTKPFAKAAARLLEMRYPGQVVSDMKKSLRSGKVLVDWSQNDAHKTTVCVYSLRAQERPTVSMPVTWRELETCLENRDPNSLVFLSNQALERVEKVGDLFEPVLSVQQTLPPAEELGGSVEQRRLAIRTGSPDGVFSTQSPHSARRRKAKP
jgi:bifunctional non-homologous end joining protein LigD